MRNYRKLAMILAMSMAVSAAGAGSAMADVIIAGQSKEEASTSGPGASGSAVTVAPSASVTVVEGVSPSAAETETQTSTAVQAPTAAVVNGSSGNSSMPLVSAEPAQNAVENAVTLLPEYGSNGELLRVGMILNDIKGTITYGVYVNNGGYLPWQADGILAGGTEDSTHVEAIQIALTGDAGKEYDVYYRGVSANAGQHGWACNEELMGTVDRGDYLTNLEVVLVPKDSGAPGDYTGRFYSNHSEYIHISDDGSTYANNYTGWVDHDRARYYFLNGQAVTGWQYIDGLKFYFNNSGALIMDVDDIIGKQSSYIIKVNKELNCATVYAPDGDNGYIIPVKSMLTSTGDDTPLGTYYTPEKYRWRFMINDTWTQYATRINGGVLFHSITYASTSPTDLITYGYNMLGVTRSHGCVRLTCANAKWLYDNCALGTAVEVYNDSEVPGPFFKPYQKWIPEDQTWDPTDPACADM
ncbi:MAG: L,D-transpeptidase family protein [Clostridiales bacterium]|nr:L,D-transpeptidase family protein [Clostridiales bacterium]